MLENATVARPYAQAVFEVAQAQSALPEWADMLNHAAAIVADPDMRRVLNDPRIERAKKERVFFDIAGDKLNPAAKNMVRVLLDAGRVLVLPDIAELYGQLKAQTEGMLDIDVATAFPLEPSEETLLANAVKKRLGRDVGVHTHVDPALIGGAIIRAGDLVIDVSVRGRLKQLANRFI